MSCVRERDPKSTSSAGGWSVAVERDDLFRLIRLVQVKDACTAAHTWRVALYTQELAESMNLDFDTIRRLMRGAAMHDIGKIDLPSKILNKPGPLTEEEFETVKQHPMHGETRLRLLGEDDPLVLSLVRSHHERIDGSGYPDGLEGNDIPIAASLFAVIDSFDAMTSIRPYRQARTRGHIVLERAIDELHHKAGTWYCAEAVEQFTDLITSGRVDWIQRHFNDREKFAAWSEPLGIDDIERTVKPFRSMVQTHG